MTRTCGAHGRDARAGEARDRCTSHRSPEKSKADGQVGSELSAAPAGPVGVSVLPLPPAAVDSSCLKPAGLQLSWLWAPRTTVCSLETRGHTGRVSVLLHSILRGSRPTDQALSNHGARYHQHATPRGSLRGSWETAAEPVCLLWGLRKELCKVPPCPLMGQKDGW